MIACHTGGVDVVVVTKLDRFSRSILHALTAFAELERYSVIVECTDEPSEPGLIRNIKLAVAEDERKRITERMTLGKRAIAAKGYWPGGVIPYGFTAESVPNTKHSRLVVNEDEARVLHLAASMMIAGDTITKTVDTLNALGHSPRRARQWNYQILRHSLSREQLNGTVFDRETFAEVQNVLAQRRKLGPQRQRDHAYPLSKRLFGTCGAHYAGMYRKERDDRWYVCANKRWVNRHQVCDDSRFRADEIEQSVWWALVNFVADEDALMEYAEREWFDTAARRELSREERDKAAVRVRELEERLTTKVAVLLDEGLDAKVVAQMAAQWNAELEAARQLLVQCERADASLAQKERKIESLRKAKIAFRLMNPTPEEQTRLYEALDVKVQLTSEGTLIVSGELGLAVEVFANGVSDPAQLLKEMLATPSLRTASHCSSSQP